MLVLVNRESNIIFLQWRYYKFCLQAGRRGGNIPNTTRKIFAPKVRRIDSQLPVNDATNSVPPCRNFPQIYMADEIEVRVPKLTSRSISQICLSNDVNEGCAKNIIAELEVLGSARDLLEDGGFVFLICFFLHSSVSFISFMQRN